MQPDGDLTPEKRKQLIDFYKAMKMASQMFTGNQAIVSRKIAPIIDQIILELKREQPDASKIQTLTDNLQSLSANALSAK
jgi:hypothetical protein